MATWKPVVGFAGLYEVSDDGDVRSLNRLTVGKHSYRRSGVILRPRIQANGYRKVRLYGGSGSSQYMLIHRVVLEAFAGPCPQGHQGCHGNGNRADNRLCNLRWDTVAANELDKIAHGTRSTGEKNGRAYLTDAEVREIRELYKASVHTGAIAEIGRRFGITTAHARDIVRGRIWKHVA